jgi:hypothetical protein
VPPKSRESHRSGCRSGELGDEANKVVTKPGSEAGNEDESEED